MVRRVLEDGVDSGRSGRRLRGEHAHGAQVARPCPQRRCCRSAEPQLGAAPGRQQAAGTLGRHDRPAAPRLPDDRRGHRRASPPATQHRRRSSRPPRPGPAGAPTSPASSAHSAAARSTDTKKLARFRRVGHRSLASARFGWRRLGVVHVAGDDASRLAFVEVLPDEKRQSVTGVLAGRCAGSRASASGRARDDRNGSGTSRLFRKACECSACATSAPVPNAHQRRPAVQTSARGHALPYRSSQTRAADLPRWLRHYNHEGPHASLARQQRTGQVS